MTWIEGSKIGFGGMGVVYEARRDGGDPDVFDYAIKRLQKSYGASPQAVRRFSDEIRMLEALDHPNVMPVIDSGLRRGIPWYAMPRGTHGSLKDALGDGRTDERTWTIEVFRGVLAGVAHAHATGILHRDLKPSNVLLFGIVPKVSDFGVGKQVDIDRTTLTWTAQQIGTVRYMAPEQFADAKRSGPPADVYSLGKVFAYMLSGREPEPLKVDLTDVPDEFRFFIDKCCRDDPNDRYTDAAAALDDFDNLLQSPAVELPPLDRARELANGAQEALGTEGEIVAIEALSDYFRGYPDEEAIFQNVLPRLPRPLLRAWAERQPVGFREALSAFDQHVGVNGALRFEYCDVVADFLVAVFPMTSDLALRRLIVARLLEVGYSHNRFHVADVTVDLLASLKSSSEVALAAEVIDHHRPAAAWIAEGALKRPLRQPIAEALRAAIAEREQQQAATPF